MKEIQSGHSHEVFMERCLEMAMNGFGKVAPNPMVGAVIIHKGKVIGEGYHKKFGMPHAEVNAIKSVRNASLLKESTLYVNLEPCAHTGKTPPCCELIIEKKIPHVVIGTSDPNPLVSGKGIEKLRKSKIKVETGILQKKCIDLNRRFFTFHRKRRPYIILKWAQTSDGFIDTLRKPGEPVGINWISHPLSRVLVHKWRSEEQGIMVGTNTILTDNPQLTVREWTVGSPVRIILDRKLRIPDRAEIFNKASRTLIYNELKSKVRGQTEWIKESFHERDILPVLNDLYEREMQSIIVEGGRELLEHFIDNDLWDEARVFIGNKKFGSGLKAPEISRNPTSNEKIMTDHLLIFRNLKNEFND